MEKRDIIIEAEKDYLIPLKGRELVKLLMLLDTAKKEIFKSLEAYSFNLILEQICKDELRLINNINKKLLTDT